MTDRSRRLRELDQALLWHPFTQMAAWPADEAPIIEKGEGAYLFDADGRRYFDGVSSLWCNVHGHRHPTIDAAVRRQLDKIAHSTLLGLGSAASIEFAENLCAHLPPGLTRLFFSDNGATAVEVALKIAFSHHRHRGDAKRTRFITFDGAYHGDTIGSVSVGGIDLFHEAYRPLLFETIKLPYPFCFRCPWNLDPADCAKACFGRTADAVEAAAESCAAVVIEPLVQGASGIRPAPSGFLRMLREVCVRHGLLLIADEVATGFGRTGTMFACEQEGVTPDLMALAKGISGGYLPLAATVVREEVYETFLGRFEEFKTFFHGHTYTGNALACAAGSGSLQVFREEKVLESLPGKIDALRRALEAARGLAHVADVRQAGVMAGIEIMEDAEAKTPYPAALRMGHKVILRAREKGVIIRPLGDVIVLNPPLCSTPQEMVTLANVAIESIVEATET